MPVAWGGHQFKNWWQPYDLPHRGKSAIESLPVYRIPPHLPQDGEFLIHRSPQTKAGQCETLVNESLRCAKVCPVSFETGKSFGTYRGRDSNPYKCPMPVAWGGHQFKNWWQPYDLPHRGKSAIESLPVYRIPPHLPQDGEFLIHRSPQTKAGQSETSVSESLPVYRIFPISFKIERKSRCGAGTFGSLNDWRNVDIPVKSAQTGKFFHRGIELFMEMC